MIKPKHVIVILSFLLPFMLIFRALFSGSHLAWGDAPFFYSENLKELFNQPLSWDFRNSNFGADQRVVLWLYLPTFLMGLLNHLFELQNDFLIRLIFYFPATILSFVSFFILVKQFVKDSFAQVLGALLYSFNTYFLILIDGGQIGVALSYGLFPLVIYTLRNILLKITLKNFIISTVTFALISNIDIRITLLSIFTILLICLVEKAPPRRLIILPGIFLLTVCLDAFWILPFIQSLITKSLNIQPVQILDLLNLSNGFFIFNPHFPKNEFGQITQVPLFYGLVPFLIFGSLLFKKDSRILYFCLASLLIIFLIKGGSEPAGFLYSGLMSNLPFGIAFRDSSKFFIPLLVFSAILLAFFVEKTRRVLKDHKVWDASFVIFIYIYILILVWPAVVGNMSGTLSTKTQNGDYQIIYENLKKEASTFRTLWFPERPPLAFSTQGKEALSANLLYKDTPFSSMIIGNYDLFYFLHDEDLLDWFRLLGIKYAFFPEDQRKKTLDVKHKEERVIFLNFVDKLGFKKLDWGISFPGYEFSDTQPKIFGQEKVILVLGGTDIYDDLKTNIKNFSLVNQGFIFMEDGVSSSDDLLGISSDSVYFISKSREPQDLTMTFLMEKFLDEEHLISSDFGRYKGKEYIDLKYELLRRGIASNDLGFGKGMYFSSEKGEKLKFKKSVSNGKFRLAFRSISATDSAGLKYKIGNIEGIVNNIGGFVWKITEPIDLATGSQEIIFENLGEFNGVNVVSLLSEEDYQSALQKTVNFYEKFKNSRIKDLEVLKPVNIPYKQINTTRYEIDTNSNTVNWIIFSDHFDSNWKLDGKSAQPLYSMINGFSSPGQKHLILEYSPQSSVALGVKISVASLVVLTLITLLATFKALR